jgi:hypothetical protein
VESALASHGAAAAAKSDAVALAPQEAPADVPAAAPPVSTADRPVVSAAPTPDSDLAVVPPAQPAPATDDKLRVTRRHLAGWRAVALFMSFAVFALAGLVALWKYVPERVPPALKPLELMRLLGIRVEAGPPARKPAPPESQYNE